MEQETQERTDLEITKVKPEELLAEVEEMLRQSAEEDAQRMTKHYSISPTTLARLAAAASG